MDSSSPVLPSLLRTGTSRRREKRNPSVTPRRFGRFFTPRSQAVSTGSRHALSTLDEAAVNQQVSPLSPDSLGPDPFSSDPVLQSSPTQGLERKRRRLNSSEPLGGRRGPAADDLEPPRFDLSGLSCHLSRTGSVLGPNTGHGLSRSQSIGLDKDRPKLDEIFRTSRAGVRPPSKHIVRVSTSTSEESLSANPLHAYHPRPIRKLENRGFDAQLLDREHGFATRNDRRHLAFPTYDYKSATASFHSKSSDFHECQAFDEPGNTIPFSLASAHRHDYTAVGDEQGNVRFFRTDGGEDENRGKLVMAHLPIHDNAIMDLDFSPDDLRLASAWGDRTGGISDVTTGDLVCKLDEKHWDSLRQVSFQPGQSGGNVLATSDRAGTINIWDVRCSAIPLSLFTTQDSPRDLSLQTPCAVRSVNSLTDTLARLTRRSATPIAKSITAIHWLPEGREHLLLTGSEANACVKLWDTRYIKPRHATHDTPLATTQAPPSHVQKRPWGITSLAVGNQGTRLYATCKDSTVYAYSIPHLMLGHAPEMEMNASKRKPHEKQGLGPLYGFKHESFRVNTFYVKSAIRPTTHTQGAELLAVGSSDKCAVLFPTDERHMKSTWARTAHGLPDTAAAASQALNAPITRNGTALVRGHEREVTTVSWSRDGRLVTAGDDYLVREWHEGDRGGAEARHLRQVGEFGGERHMAGWADVGDDWDEEDD